MRPCLMIFAICISSFVFGQTNSRNLNTSDSYLNEVKFRGIGPYRGGRSAAVCGVADNPNLFYMGATGGGVWKTEDAGATWVNISDPFFGGSIGAVTVSESDPNVIYVGGGECTVRGNVSSGSGMWKSVDAGKTWHSIGLKNSRHIPRVRVHPNNPDIVYAAVLGNIYIPTADRGVYKSVDGGQTWRKVLYSTDKAGAIDLCFDPTNPRIMFASTWNVKRTPYSLESGGEGSALWKSIDGGETWQNISSNKGLPEGIWGISGVSVSAVNPDRVFAIIENENGGVYRSDDGGATWTLVNSDRSLRQRAWYYSRIYADTQDQDKVYVLNVSYGVSKDGGKSFEMKNAPHGDHHDLWISPENNQSMVIADDGGAQVSTDAGQNWSTYFNQPTAQFYRVTTDNDFPYRIYVAQQDNSTLRVRSRTDGYSIGESDWESTAGCECGHIAIDPRDMDIVYGGCYDGLIQRKNHRTGQSRAINVWPDLPMGHGAEGMKYRFQWNFPIFISPHDPSKLYTASNHLHVSSNGGKSWEIISPDLTRNDPSKLGPSGGPITKDNTSVEYYCTIFAAIESSLEEGVLWAGSDDGLLHISRDGGKNWSNVTPSGMPEWIQINSIEENPHQKGGLYVAATMYKSGDFRPYLYKTDDYGKTWKKIVSGIGEEDFTRVIRADSEVSGLLYAGTENGLYISYNDGANWKKVKGNLPIVPITDMTVKDDNLVIATQGRSIWIWDDLSLVRQLGSFSGMNDELFIPQKVYRMGGGQSSDTLHAGQNHPGGAMISFFLKDKPAESDTIQIVIKDTKDQVAASYSTHAEDQAYKLSLKQGMNTWRWNLKYPAGKDFEGMIMWWASLSGPMALPGQYMVELHKGDKIMEAPLTIIKDPRADDITDRDMQQQFDFVQAVVDKTSEAHTVIKEIRQARSQMTEYKQKLGTGNDDIVSEIDSTLAQMKSIEEQLYQTKNRSGQDPLNFPVRLTNKLAHLNSLVSTGYYAPTDQMEAVRKEITGKIDVLLAEFAVLKNQNIPKINALIKGAEIDAIKIGEED